MLKSFFCMKHFTTLYVYSSWDVRGIWPKGGIGRLCSKNIPPMSCVTVTSEAPAYAMTWCICSYKDEVWFVLYLCPIYTGSCVTCWFCVILCVFEAYDLQTLLISWKLVGFSYCTHTHMLSPKCSKIKTPGFPKNIVFLFDVLGFIGFEFFWKVLQHISWQVVTAGLTCTVETVGVANFYPSQQWYFSTVSTLLPTS